MKKTLIKAVSIAAALGLLATAGIALAGNQNDNKDHKPKTTYMCEKNEDGVFHVVEVGKDGIVLPNFAYTGPTDHGKPTKEGADWCKTNVPVPPVVVTPPVVTPAPVVVPAPTVLPDTGGHGTVLPN